MEITFLGHASLAVRGADTAGTSRLVLTDPYRSGAFGGRLAHAPITLSPDVVTVSHYHVDHSHVGPALAAPGGPLPPVVDTRGHAGGIDFDVRFTYHDRALGTRMGLTGMVAWQQDGLRVAHLGDIGCPLTGDDVTWLGDVDVLIWPVGGTYTLGPEDAQAVLDAVRPRVALPVHYEGPRCRLGMAPIEALAPALRSAPIRDGGSTWSSAEGLPARTTVLVLEPAL